ncbi:hypothetical protein [Butyrivibrio sp. JL13D10]|uniref:hypothetical protein n=1 Tax=Butyrivibrio sp. JL13D10 TaxID=3236815 RepID=UPI0038B5FE87
MIIQSPSSKEKVAFTLFRLILLFALASFLDKSYLGGEEGIFYAYLLCVIFLDAALSVLIFYLIGWWMKRKQLSVSLSIRGKSVILALMTCFMIITIPILLKSYWHYFDGSCSGTYVGRYSNDKVVLDQFYFCYNDVVEADFKVRDGLVVLDMDSIRIKENSSDIYTDSQKQKMLDEIIFLAGKKGISLGGENYEMWFNYDITHFDATVLDRVREADSVADSGYSDGSWWGTYASTESNKTVVFDRNYFCYNDVVEAGFKCVDGAIVLDMDSIRIKENSSDTYTDSQNQKMLDEIIALAENNDIHLSATDWEDRLYLYYNMTHFDVLDRVVE